MQGRTRNIGKGISIATEIDQIRQLELLENQYTAQYKVNMCGTSKVTLPPVGDNVRVPKEMFESLCESFAQCGPRYNI